jgi:hypothetical protein
MVGGWMVSRPVSGVLSTFPREGWVAIHLSDLPGESLVAKACGSRTPTFDLAPGGVYLAVVITHVAGAPLPHRFTLTCTRSPEPSAVCSLWHCPARHRDSHFASTLPCGAPTFLTTCWPLVLLVDRFLMIKLYVLKFELSLTNCLPLLKG